VGDFSYSVGPPGGPPSNDALRKELDMKTQRIVAAIAAASLTLSSGAFAQTSGAQDLINRETGRQDPNGPLKSPQQLRDDQRAVQQSLREDQRHQQRSGHGDYRVDQPDSRGYDNRGHDNRGYDNRGYDNRGHDNRGYDNRGYDSSRYGYREGGYRGQGRGVGPSHSWYRGDRLPSEYRSRHYVVEDWRGHHLYAPPRGYQWVQSGGDYVLVAVATGIIASILLNQ
jgi:Ni/Co efflux regulator RcnB